MSEKLAINGVTPVISQEKDWPTHDFGEDDVQAVSEVIRSGKIGKGEQIAAFQREYADRYGRYRHLEDYKPPLDDQPILDNRNQVWVLLPDSVTNATFELMATFQEAPNQKQHLHQPVHYEFPPLFQVKQLDIVKLVL